MVASTMPRIMVSLLNDLEMVLTPDMSFCSGKSSHFDRPCLALVQVCRHWRGKSCIDHLQLAAELNVEVRPGKCALLLFSVAGPVVVVGIEAALELLLAEDPAKVFMLTAGPLLHPSLASMTGPGLNWLFDMKMFLGGYVLLRWIEREKVGEGRGDAIRVRLAGVEDMDIYFPL
jgi:hypothetical protein